MKKRSGAGTRRESTAKGRIEQETASLKPPNHGTRHERDPLRPASPSDDPEVQSRLELALSLQHQGNRREAQRLFEEVLRARPQEVRALYSLAVLQNGERNYPEALALLEKVVRLAPAFVLGQYALASVLQSLGRLAGSLVPLKKVLEIQPGHPEAAERLARAQRWAEPFPASNEPVLGLGVIRPAQVPRVPTIAPHAATKAEDLAGRIAPEAGVSAPASQPQGVPPWLIEAFHLKDQGRHDEARIRFELLLKHDPENLLALYALCEIAMAVGKPDFALHFANRAIRKDPAQARAHFSRGSVLQSMGLYEAALLSFDEALRLKPDLVEGWNNRTHLLHAMHRNAEALASVEKALAIRPDDLKALTNRGYLLSGYKRHAEAADMYERQLGIDPEYEYAAGLLALARLHACDWRDEEKNRQRVIEGIRQGKRSCNPLAFFAMSDDPAEHLRCVRIFAEHRFPPTQSPLWHGERYRHRKPRL